MISAQANLEYCPFDILLEVMHYLDLKDVLRLREVYSDGAVLNVFDIQ